MAATTGQIDTAQWCYKRLLTIALRISYFAAYSWMTDK